MIEAAPSLHQIENHIIDGDYYWTKTGELTWAELSQLVDRPETLWANGDSTYYGLNDRVRMEAAGNMTNSLVLIQPASLSVLVQTEGAKFGNPRRRVRADFIYQGTNYCIVVTDPVAERAFLAKPDNRYHVDDAYLCISLAGAHTDGYCYKLIAAVIMKDLL
jgi:hypothetical protein